MLRTQTSAIDFISSPAAMEAAARARAEEVNRARAAVKAKAAAKQAAKKAAKKAMARAKAKAKAEARAAASCELCHGSLGFVGEACHGVALTVSCSACAYACRSGEGMLLASQTRAKEEFKVGQPDLGLIRHVTKPNPYNSRNPIKLYVRSELQVSRRLLLAVCCFPWWRWRWRWRWWLWRWRKVFGGKAPPLCARHLVESTSILTSVLSAFSTGLAGSCRFSRWF